MGKKKTIKFAPAEAPVRELVTKFGGQPVWLEKPAWPLSKETGNPMRVPLVTTPLTATTTRMA